MSELFYNRNQNISGITPITSLTFIPEYGSSVSFSHRSNSYETNNGYMNSIPLSPNSLIASFDLRFKLSESETQQLVNYVESGRGVDMIEFSDPSNFYKTISGTCDNYSISHLNRNNYEVSLSLQVNELPNLFNWSGMSFVNNELDPWLDAQSYPKYKTIYQAANTSKLDNFFYCSGDHSSNATNQPTGTASIWTQEFFFEPSFAFQNSVDMAVAKNELKNSFIQNVATRKHLSTLQWEYDFQNISTEKAKAIMHFLENKGGYRRFIVRPNSVYNQPKVCIAPSWQHTWNFDNSHSIRVTLQEDPLGVVPSDS